MASNTTNRTINIDFNADTAQAQRGIENMSETLKKSGESLKQLGSKLTDMTKIAGATSAGLMTGFAKTASDMEQSTGKMRAQLGLTSDETEKVTAVAKDMYKNGWGDSMGDITDAIVKVKQNIKGLNDADLQKVSQNAMTLAETFDIDVGDSTKATKTLMENFGISAQQSMDIITSGMQNGLDYSGEYLDTLNEYAPQFKQMGMNASQMFNILKAGSDGGAFSLDKVADAMKEFNLRMKDGSTTTANALTAIGLNAGQISAQYAKGGDDAQKAMKTTVDALFKVQDPLQRNQLGVSLFGTQWEDLGEKAIRAMADADTTMNSFSGSTDNASSALNDNFASKFKSTMRDLQTAIEPIGKVLLDVFSQALPYLKQFGDWLASLTPEQQKMVVMIGGILVLIATAVPIIASIVETVTLIGGALTALAPIGEAVLGALGIGFTGVLAPVLAVIAVIVAVAVAVYEIITNWESIKEFFIALWDAVYYTFEAFIEGAEAIFSGAIEGIKAIWNAITDFFSELWNGIVSVVTTIWQAWLDGEEAKFEFFKNIWNVLSNFFSDLWNGIVSTITAIWDNYMVLVQQELDFFKGLWNGITEFFSGIWSGLTTGLSEAIDGALNTLGGIVDGVKGIFQAVFNFIVGGINTVIDGINNMLTFTVPDWVPVIGGTNVVSDIPHVPEWHADGGIFTKPTLLNNGKDGVGEAGAEAVLPLNQLYSKMDDITKKNSSGQKIDVQIDVHIDKFNGSQKDVAQLSKELKDRANQEIKYKGGQV
jgi:phage-related minor tail protein